MEGKGVKRAAFNTCRFHAFRSKRTNGFEEGVQRQFGLFMHTKMPRRAPEPHAHLRMDRANQRTAEVSREHSEPPSLISTAKLFNFTLHFT
jgi:hypothetical protein